MLKEPAERGVSILICTYNGATRLTPTLTAILEQEKTRDIPWEVVLVDNASTDNTAETARNLMSNSSIAFTLLNEPKPGRDNALRTGFQHVKYEFVCNVDDDTWVCRDYVSVVWEIMNNHPDVAVCGGRGEGAFEIDPPAWLRPYETALAIGPQGEKTGYVPKERNYLYGACAVYRKSLWNKLQESGFRFYLSGRKGKKLSSGEDMELCQAWQMLGYKLYYDERIQFKHYMPAGRLTWDYFRKLYKAFGRSDLVIHQYFSKLGMYTKRRSCILNNYLLYVTYELYAVLKQLPGYLFDSILSKTGSKHILNAEREIALLNELLTNKKIYTSVKKTLSDAIRKEIADNN